MGKCNSGLNRKIGQYVADWKARCYQDDIPDAADPRLEQLGKVPSYRRICKAIIKNDVTLKTLGFTKPISTAYNAIKRAEIAARPSRNKQLTFLT